MYRIPDAYLKCSQCDDAMDDESSVEAFFQLHFRLEDEEGTELYVSVSDERVSRLVNFATLELTSFPC